MDILLLEITNVIRAEKPLFSLALFIKKHF